MDFRGFYPVISDVSSGASLLSFISEAGGTGGTILGRGGTGKIVVRINQFLIGQRS